MSTPETDLNAALPTAAGTGLAAVSEPTKAAALTPDVAMMARLANEMFKAVPGTASLAPSSLAVVPLSGAQVPGVVVEPTVAALSTPTADSLRALSGALPGGDWIPNLGTFVDVMPSSVIPIPLNSAVPDFYFLQSITQQPVTAQAAASPLGFAPELIPYANASTGLFSAEALRRDFPILDQTVHGKPLIWLDNAATTQKPRAVIDRITRFYENENSNIHRAAHVLAGRSTDAYEAARESARRFLNAGSVREIVFVRGATEAINLVAQSWGRRHINAGDEIVITWIEHHSNIVPWQLLAAEKGARLRVAPVDDRGQIILEEYEKLLGPKTRLVSMTHVSNALGTVLPVREMTAMAHRYGARVLVDGAQAVSHMPVDVQSIDSDWYVFSGHKVFAPTGIGVLRGKSDVLDASPPWQGGGNMIADVTFEKTVYHSAPMRFEAGTGNIADAVGLGAALDYLMAIGLANVARHEHALLDYGTRKLLTVPGLHLVGTAAEKAGVMSFVLDGFKTEEVGAALDREGIAVRAGHHCAQPALRRFGLESSVRPSLALYNTNSDIDALVNALCALTTR